MGAMAGNRMEIKKKGHTHFNSTVTVATLDSLSLQFWFEPDSRGGHWSSCGNFLRWNETPPDDRHRANSARTRHSSCTHRTISHGEQVWIHQLLLFVQSKRVRLTVWDNDMETEGSRWKKIFAAIILKALCRPNKMREKSEKRRGEKPPGRENWGAACTYMHAPDSRCREWRNWKKVKVGERSLNFSPENRWCWGSEIIRCCNSTSPRIHKQITQQQGLFSPSHTHEMPSSAKAEYTLLFISILSYLQKSLGGGEEGQSISVFLVCTPAKQKPHNGIKFKNAPRQHIRCWSWIWS